MAYKKLFVGVFAVAVISMALDGIAAESGEGLTMELKRLIEKQQEQIDAQQKQIEVLVKQVEELKTTKAVKAPDHEVAEEEIPKDLVRSGGDKVSTKIYGQVNRGVLYVNDGENKEFFHVDNDNSSTRIGLRGSAKLNDDFSVGTKIEVQFESNSTASVSQDNKSGVGPNNFTERHLDLFLNSETFGKLSLGQGDTASNGSSEVDLSGTSVIGYSGVGDLAGGMKFFDQNTNALSNVTIGGVFSNMDGLSRRDRVRYDTPPFAGFTVSGSVTERDQQDIVLRYSGKFPWFKLAGAAAYANTDASSSTENQYNGSVSVLLDNGLNVTLAGGHREMIASNREEPLFYYAKLGYKADFFAIGTTALALDYGRFNDIAQNDDKADTFALMAVQNLTELGTELYIGYRLYSLERPGSDFDEINAVLAGARIKF
jgi:predicted porin